MLAAGLLIIIVLSARLSWRRFMSQSMYLVWFNWYSLYL